MTQIDTGIKTIFKKCRFCGNEFIPNKYNPKQFCCYNPECRKKRKNDWDNKNETNRICIICGEKLPKKKSKYCSKECRNKNINKKRMLERRKKGILPQKYVSKYLDKEEINNLYWKDKKSATEIAKIKECNKGTIRNFMIKNNIPRRNQSETNKISQKIRYNKIKQNTQELEKIKSCLLLTADDVCQIRIELKGKMGWTWDQFHEVYPTYEHYKYPKQYGTPNFYKNHYWIIRSAQVIERAKHICVDCGGWGDEVDHLKNVWYYPEHCLDPDMLECVCVECHNKRTRKRYEQWLKRQKRGWD